MSVPHFDTLMSNPPDSLGAQSFTFTLHVTGMSCTHCQQTVAAAALKVSGVVDVQVDLDTGMLTVQGGEPAAVRQAVIDAGYGVTAGEPRAVASRGSGDASEAGAQAAALPPARQVMLNVSGMHCASCVRRVEEAMLGVQDVCEASVNLLDASALSVGGDPDQLVEAIRQAGYEASLAPSPGNGASNLYIIDILGMHCASCVSKVERAILAVPGVTTAEVNLLEKKALVQGGSPDQVVQTVLDAGYGAVKRVSYQANGPFYLKVQPSPGPDEVEQMRSIVMAQDAEAVLISEGSGRLRIQTIEHPADVLTRIADMGFQATIEEIYIDPALAQADEARRDIRQSWFKAGLALVVGGVIMGGDMAGWFPDLHEGQNFWIGAALCCLLTMVLSGGRYFLGAWKQLRHRSANMDTLVALGTGAAWIASAAVIVDPDFIPGGRPYLYLDASVMILAFLQFGHALETRAKRTTSEAIGSLVKLRARTAVVLRAAGSVEIPLSLLRLGDRLRVKPGETVPNDGIIVEGRTTVDEAMLTGEPLAVAKTVGDNVTGGTMNRSGTFVLKVSRLGEDTTLSRIIGMVKAAQLSKPPIGRLVDRIAAVFVPIVLGIALCTFLFWLFFGPEPQRAFAISTAIAVLVIACPCALGLATPIAIMVGMSRAAECNVLIRNSDALQSAATLTHLVVDKTGTLTQGKPSVTGVFPALGSSKNQVLQWAASLESGSEHPLAEAVLVAQQETGESLLGMQNFSAIPGRGVEAELEGVSYFLGNHQFLSEKGVALPADLQQEAHRQAARGGTPVWLGRSSQIAGLLIIKDLVREDSAAAIQSLQRMGLTVVMCTGDNKDTAEAVAREVGITKVRSEILPEAKLQVVADLQAQGFRVGMIGDGVNDAPALARADTGFAIGSGTDVAIENADITLSGDSLMLVATAIALSRAALRNIKQNLFGAFIYNLIGIPLAAGLLYPLTGWLLHPMFASAAMALSSVTVVSNANRLRLFKPPSAQLSLFER